MEILKRSGLVLAVALLCPYLAEAAPRKRSDLIGTYQIQGSDSFGAYTGTMHLSWEWPSVPVGMKAELEYADGTKRVWQTGGWYSRKRGSIRFRYTIKQGGLIGRLPGAGGQKKLRISGEYFVNADATRLSGSLSGVGYSGRDVVTRARPTTRAARLKGTYTVRSNWASMTTWELRFYRRAFSCGEVKPAGVAPGPWTRCEWLNGDTLQFSVQVEVGDGVLIQQVLIARVVANPAGVLADLEPLRCYTVTIDLTSGTTRVVPKPDGVTTIEQPDGRVLD